MKDSRTFWLILMNAVLGALVLFFIVTLVTGVMCEWVQKLRHRKAMLRELDHDMEQEFGPGHPPRPRS